MARRSRTSSGFNVGAPWTWQRKPSSAYFSAFTIPDRARRSDSSTSSIVLPIEETIPIPVTTTRLISSASQERRTSNRRNGGGLEKTDPKILGFVDSPVVRFEPAVCHAQHELASEDPFEINSVDDLFHAWQNLVGEFHFADAERPASARRPEPTQIETHELP